MTDKEKEQWRELLQYIEKEILNYDDNQHLQKNGVLRIRGILNGKVFANNNTEDNGNYGIEVVFNTFKLCKPQILPAIQAKDFKTEDNKIAYICAIIRNNVNDMYERMKNIKQEQENGKKVDTTIIQHKNNNYKRRTIDKGKYDDLW